MHTEVPGATAPDLSVVVVTYNSAQTIATCLRSIAASDACAELVVVDNASPDGTPDLVASLFPAVQVIASRTNEGFARACNRGWRETAAPFVLLLNPDTELRRGAIRALLDFAAEHPRAALIGPKIINADGSLQHSCFRFPRLRMVITGFFGQIPLDSPTNGRYRVEQYDQSHPVEHLLGACLLVRREAAEQLGLLDEGFYIYFEETDWCYRMQAAGWENWYTPSATVMHHGAHSTSRDPERMSAEFYRSQARFYRKHYGWRDSLLLKVLSVLGVAYWASRTTRGVLCRRVSREAARRRLVSYWQIVRA